METQKGKVLVAEDDLSHREMIASHLKELGCDVVHAQTGAHVLTELVNNGDINFAILDERIKGEAGIDVLERFRQAVDCCAARDVPVVIMTGNYTPEKEIRARVANAAFFLLKPFPKEVLSEVVGQLLRRHHLQNMLIQDPLVGGHPMPQ